MSLTPWHFRAQALRFGIRTWFCYLCTGCRYPCRFLFGESGEVRFDHGCGCRGARVGYRDSNWWEVWEFYHLQTHPEIIAQFDAYWHLSRSVDVDPRDSQVTQ